MAAYYNLTTPNLVEKLLAPNENIVDFRAAGISTGNLFTKARRTIENIGQFYPNEFIAFQDAWVTNTYFYWRTNPQGVNEVLATPLIPTALDILNSCNSFVTKFNTSNSSRHTATIDFAFNVNLGFITAYIIIDANFDGAGGVLGTLGVFPGTGGANSIYDTNSVAGTYPYFPQELQKPITVGKVYTNDETTVGREYPSTSDKTVPVLVGEQSKPYLSASNLQFNPISLMKDIQYVQLPQYEVAFRQSAQLKRYWVEFITKGTLGNASGSVSDVLDQTGIYWALNASQDIICGYDLLPYVSPTVYREFLTNAPNVPTIAGTFVYKQPVVWGRDELLRNESEFLSWISEIGGVQMTVNAFVRYEDGTNASLSKLIVDEFAVPILSSLGVITADVSPDYFGMETLGFPALIADWQIWISYVGTGRYTEKMNYRRIANCLPNRVQLLFLNALGGWDTYYFIGDNDSANSRGYVEFDRTIDNAYSCDNMVNGVRKVTFNKGLKLNSGQLTRAEYDWLYDLAKSPEVYTILQDGTMQATVITKVELKEDSFKSLYTLSIEVKRSADENSLTI